MSIKTIDATITTNTSGVAKKINKGAEKMVFDILQSTQYSTPIPSTVRELVTNACDSQREKEMALEILRGKKSSEDYYIVRNAFNNKPLQTFSKDTYWNTKMVKELKQSKIKLNGSTIENLDFEELIERYSMREGDFVYLDPPYIIADKKDYYRNRFDEEMHLKLKDTVDKISLNNAKFMLSYDDREELREMYKEYNITTIKTKYVGRREDPSKEFSELVITNYKPQKQETLF